MARVQLTTGATVKTSGIYKTDNPKTPEITLTAGDRVPPIGGKAGKVTLVRPTQKGTQ